MDHQNVNATHDAGVPIVRPIEPSNPACPTDANAVREFDAQREAAHRLLVTQAAHALAGKSPTEVERTLAEAAAHDIAINERLGAIEVRLLTRVEALVGATKLDIAKKLMEVMTEVSSLRRGGTRRVEETLRVLSELQTREHIARRPHLRAA